MTDSDARRSDQILASLEGCKKVLDQIAVTCCMPERSPQMKEASATLDEAVRIVRQYPANPSGLSQVLDCIADCGSRIGRLYVTCCTETREALYQRILGGLNDIQRKVEPLLTRPDR